MTQEEKQAIMKECGLHERHRFTGSTDCSFNLQNQQSYRASQDTQKDHHSRRGLLKMVGHRRNLLAYLQRKISKDTVLLLQARHP